MFFNINFLIKLFSFLFLIFSFNSYSSDNIFHVACATNNNGKLDWMPLVSPDGVETVVSGLKGIRRTIVSYSYFLHIELDDYKELFVQCQDLYGDLWVPVPIEDDRRPYYVFRYNFDGRTRYALGYSRNYMSDH